MAIRRPIPPIKFPGGGGTSDDADAAGGIPGRDGVPGDVPTIPGTSAPGVPSILPTSNQLVQQGLDSQRGAIDYLVGTLVNKQLELLAKNDAGLKGIIATLTRQVQQSYGQVLAQNSTVVAQLSNFLQSQLAEQAMLASAVRGMVPADRLPSGLKAVDPTGLVGSLSAAVHLPPIPPIRLPQPPPPGGCPPGYYWNGAKAKCEPMHTPPPDGCPPGWYWSLEGGGRCLPTPVTDGVPPDGTPCPQGYVSSGSGGSQQCILPIPPPPPPPPLPPPTDCPPGQCLMPLGPLGAEICVPCPVNCPPPPPPCCPNVSLSLSTAPITIAVNVPPETVNVQPAQVSVYPTINVSGGGTVGEPPPPPPPIEPPPSQKKQQDFPVEIRTPLSLLFGPEESDYQARVDEWTGGLIANAQGYPTEIEFQQQLGMFNAAPSVEDREPMGWGYDG